MIITYQPKTFESSKIVDIKPVTTEHPKTSYSIYKIIRKDGKVGSNRSLNSGTKN